MSWSDGEVHVKHIFHLENMQSYPVTPPQGAVVLHQWIVNCGYNYQRIVAGTNPPAQYSVPQVEMHYLITLNPNL